GASSVFLIGNLLFRRATGGAWSWSHLAGAVALAVLPVGATALSPLALSWIGNGVLLGVFLADELTARR
ncbi:MAG: low temperature requirement protein A, partial [Dehalococcoidia bacterium]